MLNREDLLTNLHERVERNGRGDVYYTIYLIQVENGERKELKLGENGNHVVLAIRGHSAESIYIYNLMFRLANLALIGTKYEKLPWEYYSEKELALSDDAYIKRLDSDNYVYLLTDYFYHT